MSERWRRWLPAVVWALGIEVLTSWPNPPAMDQLPSESDKVAHFMMYLMLGFWVARAVRQSPTPRTLLTMLLSTMVGVSVFGALDEWHQLFIPGRSMEFGDWLADSLGGIAGVGLLTLSAGVAVARRNTSS
ncbi:MAG: VanZ family protein [Gemmatimonadetes bacterium]|nr:VanZ family protein [Gemmatimonadota bacterium]